MWGAEHVHALDRHYALSIMQSLKLYALTTATDEPGGDLHDAISRLRLPRAVRYIRLRYTTVVSISALAIARLFPNPPPRTIKISSLYVSYLLQPPPWKLCTQYLANHSTYTVHVVGSCFWSIYCKRICVRDAWC